MDATEAGTRNRLLRNARPVRRLHAGLYLTTAFLFLSGIAVAGEGRRALEALLGGHAASALWHRWIGYVLIGAGLVVPTLRPGAALRFVLESARFRLSDLRWFATYPRFLLRPSRNAPARHDGHFDPGQRVLNCVILAAFAALSVTGIAMSFPEAVTPAAFGWSLRVHRAATWVLVASVVGHVLVASGFLPAYRGVWRAMHWDGRVPAGLARKLWPRWAEEAEEPEA